MEIIDSCQTYSIDERDFLIRPGTTDKLVVNEIWKGGIYDFLDPQPGDFILDIGGHIGIAASWFAYHGATVQTFEPIDANYSILVQNIANVPQVTAHNFPVMYQHGWILLSKQPGRNNHHASYSVIHAEYMPSVIATLAVSWEAIFQSPLILKHDGLIKIKLDVEGGEYEHLLSGDTPWFTQVDKMIIEFHMFSEKMMPLYRRAIKQLGKYFTSVHHDLEDGKGYRALSYVRCSNE